MEAVGGSPSVAAITPGIQPPAVKPAAAPPSRKEEKSAPAAVAEGETAIPAPMPGIIIEYKVKEGDKVKSGDVVVILEAMKMQNALNSPVDGTVKSINFKIADSVKKEDILAVIG